MMSLWDALRMNMMISYQELVRTFLKTITYLSDIGCLKIQGASLVTIYGVGFLASLKMIFSHNGTR
jgi:glyoxylate carboligase